VAVGKTEAMQLGAWWPFVLCTILIWGLLPRLVLLAVGRWRLSTATRALICQDPEVLALLDRLKPPRVDFGPEEEGAVPESAGRMAAPPALEPDSRSVAVIWNQALDAEAAERWSHVFLGSAFGRTINLSSRNGRADIEASLAGLPEAPGRIVVFTKGWEPPLLEFGDFLRMLRAELGTGVLITVVPIDTRGEGVSAVDRQVWAGFLARHDDPRLYVQQATLAPAESGAAGGSDP